MITVGMNYHVIEGKQQDFEEKFAAVIDALNAAEGHSKRDAGPIPPPPARAAFFGSKHDQPREPPSRIMQGRCAAFPVVDSQPLIYHGGSSPQFRRLSASIYSCLAV